MNRQIYRGICNKIFRAGLVKVRSRKSTENGIYAKTAVFLNKKSMYGAKKQAQNMQSKPLFLRIFLCIIHEKCIKDQNDGQKQGSVRTMRTGMARETVLRETRGYGKQYGISY